MGVFIAFRKGIVQIGIFLVQNAKCFEIKAEIEWFWFLTIRNPESIKEEFSQISQSRAVCPTKGFSVDITTMSVQFHETVPLF